MPKKKSDQSQVVFYQTDYRCIPIEVPEGRPKLAPGESPGFAVKCDQSPGGAAEHVPNCTGMIYASGKLTPEATISKMEIAQIEGGRQISREIVSVIRSFGSGNDS